MRNDGRLTLAVAGCAALLVSATAEAALLQWVPGDSPAARANAFVGGQEPGRQLPICRGEYNKGIHPGKIVAGKCNIGWGGKEVLLTTFETLTGSADAVQWVKTTPGAKLAPTAFVGGQEPGRVLPICRAAYQNGLHPGKIVAGKCNIGWGGREIVLTSYETMTLTPAALAPVASKNLAAAGVVAAKGDASSTELAARIAALQAERSAANLDAVRKHVLAVQKKNEQMKWAAEALKALKAGQPVTGKTASGAPIQKVAEAAGVKLTGKAENDKKMLEALLARFGKDSQADMTKLQSMIDKRNQQFELLSDILKKFAATQQSIVQNMR